MDFRAMWLLMGTSAVLAACSVADSPPPQTVPPPPAIPEPATLARDPTPLGSPGNWFTTNDYPSRALREEREGAAEAHLTISVEGRPTACSIYSSSGHPDLDTATCSNLMRRARFNPALDAEGQPTTGAYASRVSWRIPDDLQEPLPLAGSVTTSLVVGRNGWTGDCRVIRSSGDLAAQYPVGTRSCGAVYTGSPLTDRRGRPISRTYVTQREVTVSRVADNFVPRSDGQAIMPPRPQGLPQTGRVRRSFIVETDGRQTNCQIVSMSGDLANNARTGAIQCPIDRFAGPFVDANGRPERRQVVVTERVNVSNRR